MENTYRIKYFRQMIHVRVPHVCSDDPVSSFALEPLLYILLREFPQRFARGHAEQQIVFVVTRDWGTVLRFLWQRPETKQIPFFPYCTLKKNGEKRTYGSYNVQPSSTRKSSLYRYNHLRALVIAIRNFMPHRNNECRCNAAELMYEKCKN